MSHAQRLACVALLLCSTLSGQVPGDSVRIKLASESGWRVGRFVYWDRDVIAVRNGLEGQQYQFSAVREMQVSRRTNVPYTTLYMAAEFSIESVFLMALFPHDRRLTGSPGGEMAVWTGVGALVGLVYAELNPRCWHRILRRR